MLHADQSEGPPNNGEARQGSVLDPLQLWRGLHWRDDEKTRNQSEGAEECMSEGSTEKVSFGRARMNKPPSNVSMIDQARTAKELLVKEAIHNWLNHPSLNRNGGLELPRCWMAALKDTRSGPNQRPVVPTDSYSDST